MIYELLAAPTGARVQERSLRSTAVSTVQDGRPNDVQNHAMTTTHSAKDAETRLNELGLVLPAPFQSPTGRPYPFVWIRTRGSRVAISGHLPLNADGSLATEHIGKVGAELTAEDGARAAESVARAVLADLRRELGSLNRVAAWIRVLGMVNVAPGFDRIPQVVNGFSDVILAVFGETIGAHARSAVGVAELPFRVAVEVEAEVEIERAPPK